MSELNPETFDLDAWIEGADRPQHSVTVYQKAGLIADLDALAERIKNADDDEVDGPAMGGGVGKLRAEYANLAQQFHDSALTVRVQSLTKDEQAEIEKANPDLNNTELGYHVIAAALVSPKATAEQTRKINKVIGDAQFGQIIKAYHRANQEAPVVSADFLPKSSGQDASEG